MINWTAVQRRLADAKLAVGPIDGAPGAHTFGALLAYVAGSPKVADLQLSIGAGMAAHLPAYSISASAERLGNFVGQGCHETVGFKFLREIWGPTRAQQRYEGRADLGNTQPGDGQRYLGRGIFQITGRANYASMGQRLGLDLEANPALAEQPDTAVLTACEFWKACGLAALADAGQGDAISRRINGGDNGIAQRRVLVARAKELFQGRAS